MSESLPNGHSMSSIATETIADPPPEIEATLARLSAYRNVRGVMILSRSITPHATSPTNPIDIAESSRSESSGILRRSGSVFEGDGGKKYAKAVEEIVTGVRKAVASCEEDDDVKFMRIRTKRHELIITPGERSPATPNRELIACVVQTNGIYLSCYKIRGHDIAPVDVLRVSSKPDDGTQNAFDGCWRHWQSENLTRNGDYHRTAVRSCLTLSPAFSVTGVSQELRRRASRFTVLP